MKYKLQNGWTKESMIAKIKERNNGKISAYYHEESGRSFCAYRGKDNNACLVGCFIPDEIYHEGWEHNTELDDIFPEIEKYCPLDISGMRRLQFSAHDKYLSCINPNIHELAEKWINENVE